MNAPDFERIEALYQKNKEKFNAFYRLLLEYNARYNLTAITQEKDVLYKHFYDSLAGEAHICNGASVVEVGSGAGFPSMPLKIARDDLSFALVESTGKKCGYLETVVDKLDLSCVKVVNERAEVLGKDKNYREKFDVATARAVARLNILAEYCLPFVKVGGLFIAYKGDSPDEIEEAKKAFEILGGELEKVEKYELPNG
ncbi:MAG: 16S rRNA (guanine(527)-N(7))-methyltransferase RsmG, partial [Clostridia bacterium]|nr:16S rRNA (guanine(527)-N(7))-methyltransferase RsmG [Clostridia bacterium]